MHDITVFGDALMDFLPADSYTGKLPVYLPYGPHGRLRLRRLSGAVNCITSFLSQRELTHLSRRTLYEECGSWTADVLIVFGNDLPAVAEKACQAYTHGLTRKILFCGGIGHSTERLRQKMGENPRYRYCEMKGTEAELYAEIARKRYHIREEDILIENRSTNSGENGHFAMNILHRMEIPHHLILLMQDPLMQLRSRMSLERFIGKTDILVSFAPFLVRINENLEFMNPPDDLWEFPRFISLMMGEISRLRDDSDGYGPNGTGYIDHVYIPAEVEQSARIIQKAYPQYCARGK